MNESTHGWDNANELQCLIIFKRLFVEDFPHGKQIEYCRELSKETGISADNLSGRVSNLKAAAGMNSTCQASAGTVRLYNRHRHTSIEELERMVSRQKASPNSAETKKKECKGTRQ